MLVSIWMRVVNPSIACTDGACVFPALGTIRDSWLTGFPVIASK